MTFLSQRVTSIVLLFNFVSCAGPDEAPSERSPQAEAEEAIKLANGGFVKSFNQGNAASVMEYYLEDSWLLAPDRELIQGNIDILAFWDGRIRIGMQDLILSTLEIGADETLAYEVGEYTYKIVDPQIIGEAPLSPEPSGPIDTRGKYLAVWQKVRSGVWKLRAQAFNPRPRPEEALSE